MESDLIALRALLYTYFDFQKNLKEGDFSGKIYEDL